MDSVLIKFGFIEIRWYSILILVAFTIGYFLVIYNCKRKNINISIISNLCFYLVLFSIIGARIYYCLFNMDYYSKNIFDILKIWEGGLAIHGGIIGGLLCLVYFTKKYKLNLLDLLDAFCIPLALGQAIGRWGNFFNKEAYGSVVSLYTLKKYHIPTFIIKGMYIDYDYHHPTFFYESIACFILFILLFIIYRVCKTKKGQIFGIYCVIYGIVRYFIESLRTDSLMLFNLKAAQIVSVIMIITGLILIIKPLVRGKNDKQKMGHSIKR